MLNKFFRFLTFGQSLFVASLLYIGMGFMMIGAMPELPVAHAQCVDCDGCGGEEDCDEGLVCVEGSCVCP